jgi:24-methylenesterol C-methyltransferase
MGIKATDKVLDAGSGVGGPARNIHKHTNARITGITINDFQIQRARYHTKKAQMSEKVDFVQGDFTKMPFQSSTFDKVYSIEATCHATDLYDVYSEIARVLKPGGIYGTYEWLTTPLTDKSNQQHVDWLNDIEFGSGLPPMHSFSDVLVAANKAGLELIHEHDHSFDTDYAFPWYQKLDMSGISTTITHYFTLGMETLGFAEPGSTAAHGALMRAVRGLVGAGKTKTFTPMHMFVFRKVGV